MSCTSSLSVRLKSPLFSVSQLPRVLTQLPFRNQRRWKMTQNQVASEPLGAQPVFALNPDGSVGFGEIGRTQHAKDLRKEARQKKRAETSPDQTLTIHHPDLEIDEALSFQSSDLTSPADGSQVFTPINTSALPDDLDAREQISPAKPVGLLPQKITELPLWRGGLGTGKEPIPTYPFRAKTTLPVPAGLPIGDLNLYNGSKIQSGFKISKGDGKVHTRRKWHPNVQLTVLPSRVLNERVPVRTTARIVRTIKREGGLDQYLISDSRDRLVEMGEWGWRIRWLMLMRNRAGVAKVLVEKKQRFYEDRMKAVEESKRRRARKMDKSAQESSTGKLTYVI